METAYDPQYAFDLLEYSGGTLRNVIAKYFNNSYLGMVSTLIQEEDVSVDELRKLIDEVERANQRNT